MVRTRGVPSGYLQIRRRCTAHPLRRLRRIDRTHRFVRHVQRLSRATAAQRHGLKENNMARALWKGAITFGLVNIPVELYPAEEHKEFKFSMLDKRDFSPIGYKRYNKKSGKEVDWNDIIKGYEYDKNQYVVLSDED